MTNREIKFRAWTGSQMEYKVMSGFLGAFYVQGMDEKDAASMSPFNTKYTKNCPIMQSIGLHDKNGNEIYEGDIIQWTAKFRDTEIETPPKKGVVAYERQACAFWIKYEWKNPDGKIIHSYKEFIATYGDGDHYSNDGLEIIGNIHENPELISNQQ